MPFKIDTGVGRFVGVRVVPPNSPEEVMRFKDAIISTFAKVKDSGAVMCMDLRATKVFVPEVSDKILTVMRDTNQKIERSGVMLEREAATFSLQMERMVREANRPNRRTFRDPAMLEEWLAELLSPPERARLRAFLKEDPTTAT